MREKLQMLCAEKGRAAQWNAELAKPWIGLAAEAEPMLYVDGHVRVYHGKAAQLPRHYVARQKLYLRAAVDYWINALDGQPFSTSIRRLITDWCRRCATIWCPGWKRTRRLHRSTSSG